MPPMVNLIDVAAERNVCPKASDNFKKNLERIEHEMEERNKRLKEKGKAAYLFLMPKNVAPSVMI